ncbi:MAG: hypothetical protein H0T79_12325 [Deltaproteobacteria bacterium]|nr:hypothetical protein [Deltaproteobacteria bacterium]
MKSFKRSLTLLGASLVMLPALVFADPTTADEWYKEGEKQYTLQNFDKAAEAFKKGYDLETIEGKKAAYLYNVAQSYRMGQDCKKAQFFYKRYLAQRELNTAKPLSDKARKDVQDQIANLDECAKAQVVTQPVVKPEEDTTKVVDPKGKDVAVVEPEDPEEEDGITKPGVVTDQPKLVSARLIGGGSKITAGNLPVPVRGTGTLIAGYPLPINDKLTLELGGAFTVTSVAFESMAGSSRTASFVGLLANAGATYEVIPKLGIRGDLGLGGLFLSGASESPFTDNQPATGTLTMFHVRAAVSVDYAITPNLLATATPLAFSYSPPKEGLREDITAITRLDFMVGLGYRM